jgi:hypothetical protein
MVLCLKYCSALVFIDSLTIAIVLLVISLS